MGKKTSGATVSTEIGIWYDENLDCIKMRIKGNGLTSVYSNPDSKRGNPSLFKLGRLLRDAGVRHPSGI